MIGTGSVVLRRPRQIVAVMTFFVPYDCVIVTGALAAAITRAGAWLALLLPYATVCVVITVRMARVAVIAGPDGLTLRQTWRTLRFAWADVDHVAPATADPLRYVRVTLRDGRRIRCSALCTGRMEDPATLDPHAARLNALIRIHRPTPKDLLRSRPRPDSPSSARA
jgi:PH (Pleckstrin Homology) domain-containing protein